MQRDVMLQDLYCVRSDLGNLLKALGRLDEAKVISHAVKAFTLVLVITVCLIVMRSANSKCWQSCRLCRKV